MATQVGCNSRLPIPSCTDTTRKAAQNHTAAAGPNNTAGKCVSGGRDTVTESRGVVYGLFTQCVCHVRSASSLEN